MNSILTEELDTARMKMHKGAYKKEEKIREEVWKGSWLAKPAVWQEHGT